MSHFIHDDFLLQSDEAVRLYHDYAEQLPIIDYHTHLPPADVAEDRSWENISQVWLDGDHYKWRQMRANGVPERFCTGDASDRDKFDRFAQIMPYLLRNPLYHWCHLELARYFAIEDVLLSAETADEIWDRTKAALESGISARSLMAQSKVQVVCTTDDPVDSLEFHAAVRDDASFEARMLPTWRPDRALAIAAPEAFNPYLDELAIVAEVEIVRYEDLITALRRRHDHFHGAGCRLSDRGLSTCYFAPASDSQIRSIFDKARAGGQVSAAEDEQFKTALLLDLGRMDAEKDWICQLHIGALRDTNTARFAQLGPDTGFDSIGDERYAEPLSRSLDALSSEGALPKTILYNVHPRDTEMLASMLGSFEDGSVPGKVQLGAAWWFLDQKDGIERHLEAISLIGALSRFVGMVTDSRSFLSFARHEYFRRLLCNLLGGDMAAGLVPGDFDLVGRVVEKVCYRNAASYFGFDLPSTAT
jgi:glucuronate isomerase